MPSERLKWDAIHRYDNYLNLKQNQFWEESSHLNNLYKVPAERIDDLKAGMEETFPYKKFLSWKTDGRQIK